MLQEGVAALLERQPTLIVVATCPERDAVEIAAVRSPEIVVMEFPGGRRLSLSYVPALTGLRPAPRVVLLARAASRQEIMAASDLGVDACVSEEGGTEQLLLALAAVCRSERYIDLMNHVRVRSPPGERGSIVPTLTRRERDVLALIAQANTERQIARLLGLSPKTVHVHRTSIMKKFAVHNVIALVRRAIRLGLVES